MVDLFDQDLTFEQRQNMVEKYDAKAKMQKDFLHAITQAIRIDFRSDATQEYFGAIGDGADKVTAVVICESDQFLVADRDRLVDGVFTVFGKVTTRVENDVPLLQRNKLLYRSAVFDRHLCQVRAKPRAAREEPPGRRTARGPASGGGAPLRARLEDVEKVVRLRARGTRERLVVCLGWCLTVGSRLTLDARALADLIRFRLGSRPGSRHIR
jgi:hypothetical protein